MDSVILKDTLASVLIEKDGNSGIVRSVGTDIVSKMLERGWVCGPWQEIDGGRMQVWYKPGKELIND